MRDERGQLIGDMTIGEPYTLWGTIGGNVTAVAGSKFYVRGSIFGNLTVDQGARVHVFGHVSGDVVVMERAKMVHSGVIGGNAINRGGRLLIDETAKVMGKVRTESGQTQIGPEPPPPPEPDVIIPEPPPQPWHQPNRRRDEE
jgi:cytoskeletal protein CcmA (bactofilin family)